jgi:hypothetical protein
MALQRVIDILEEDLMLVHCLLSGHTGMMVQDALESRDTLLQKSPPSIVCMYNNIMDLVTYDEQVNSALYRNYMEHNCKLCPRALCWYDRRDFLFDMYDKLEHYTGLLHMMQSDVVMGTSREKRNAYQRRKPNRAISFSPIIR